MPTESISRDGVWDGIYLVVRSAALEPRAGTPRRARLGLHRSCVRLSIAWIEQSVPYRPVPMAKFLEGIRKAGLE